MDQLIQDLFNRKMIEVMNDISSREDNYILEVDETKFKNYLYQNYSIDALKINKDEKKMKERDIPTEPIKIVSIDSTSEPSPPTTVTQIIIFIPIISSPSLVHYRPTESYIDPPEAGVTTDHQIVFRYIEQNYDEDAFLQKHNKDIEKLEQCIKYINEELSTGRYDEKLKTIDKEHCEEYLAFSLFAYINLNIETRSQIKSKFFPRFIN